MLLFVLGCASLMMKIIAIWYDYFGAVFCCCCPNIYFLSNIEGWSKATNNRKKMLYQKTKSTLYFVCRWHWIRLVPHHIWMSASYFWTIWLQLILMHVSSITCVTPKPNSHGRRSEVGLLCSRNEATRQVQAGDVYVVGCCGLWRRSGGYG